MESLAPRDNSQENFLNPSIWPSDEIRAKYIPAEAFNFEPTMEDAIVRVDKSKQRMIFHRTMQYLPEETKALEEFRAYIRNNNLELPAGYDDDELMIQRFLEGNQWKQKEAYEQIIGHHRFVNSFPIELNAFKVFEDELNKGYCYVYRRDKSFRPIFVLNVAKLKKCKVPHETVLQMSTYFVQYLITRALIPGKVENWISIVDMKGVGVTEIPKNLMQAITKPLQQFFKGRLYRLHVVNAQWTIKFVWKIVKKLVDPLTVLKFVICSDDCTKDLYKLVDPANLEKRFGGQLEDKVDSFFPPQLL